MWTSIWQRSKIGHNVAFLTMGRCYMGILKRNIKKIVIIGLFLIDGWGFSTDYNDYLSVTNDQSRSVFGQVQTGKDANQTEKTSGSQSGTSNATGSFPGFLKGAISDDSSSDKLAGASVILTLSGKTVSNSTTGDDGTYFFQVPPGNYSIDVSKGGFNSKREPNVSINAFETVTRSISLSKVAVAVDVGGVGGGGDEVTLTVSSVSPSSSATNVAVSTTISATFSMLMNGSTLNTSTFKLIGGGDVSGVVTTNGATATFTPSSNLSFDTTYTATITTGAQAANAAGTTLSANTSWIFTTAQDTSVTDFRADITKGPPPLTVQFTCISKGEIQLHSHSWQFGDGQSEQSSNSLTCSHTYTKSGFYTVILEVARLGVMKSITKQDFITVDNPVTPTPTPASTPTPTPASTPTPTPIPTVTPIVTPVATATPTPSPTVTPQPTECEDGGVPSDLKVVPGSLTIRSGKSKKVKVYVKKDKRKGCAIEVKIDCIEGCGKIKLSDNIVTTNQQGDAKVKITAEKQGKGSAKIVFSVGGLTTELPIVIK